MSTPLASAIDLAKDTDGASPLGLGLLAVVVGRSTVVGKPAALLLLNRDATVTVCHRWTTDRAAHTLGANVDADGNLIGDVDAASVEGKEAALTPVPGGVGPMTTALLLQHTVTSALPNDA